MRKRTYSNSLLSLPGQGLFVPLFCTFLGPWQGGQNDGERCKGIEEGNGASAEKPVRKLMQFFESSRDMWKAKYSKLRKQYRLADNKVRAVTKSRERWKQMAEQAQYEARRLREELESIKKSAA